MTKLTCDTRKILLGFDNLFDNIERQIAHGIEKFPPHDIIKVDEMRYNVVMAVAGFSKADIKITTERGKLLVKGTKEKPTDVQYVYQGIRNRSFTKEFAIAETIVVKSAKIEDGLLKIELENIIPEEMLPKSIEIE